MALAEYDETILKLYQMHWDQDVLLGCILPWSEQGKKDWFKQVLKNWQPMVAQPVAL